MVRWWTKGHATLLEGSWTIHWIRDNVRGRYFIKHAWWTCCVRRWWFGRWGRKLDAKLLQDVGFGDICEQTREEIGVVGRKIDVGTIAFVTIVEVSLLPQRKAHVPWWAHCCIVNSADGRRRLSVSGHNGDWAVRSVWVLRFLNSNNMNFIRQVLTWWRNQYWFGEYARKETWISLDSEDRTGFT